MLVTPLDVVNACLASMGEAPINSIDEQNTFVASALDSLSRTLPGELSYGWYFNSELVTLAVQPDGIVPVPADTLSLMAKVNPPWLSIRRRCLYDNRSGQTYLADRPVQVALIRNLNLEDIPFHAQRMVRAATVKAFQASYDGDERKIADAETEYNVSRAYLMADHIRNVQSNMLYQGATADRIFRQLVMYNRFGTIGGGHRG